MKQGLLMNTEGLVIHNRLLASLRPLSHACDQAHNAVIVACLAE